MRSWQNIAGRLAYRHTLPLGSTPLRHTFVTHLLAPHGVGIQDARDLARPRDIGSTRVYAHSEQERLADIVEQFAKEQSQSSTDEDGGSSSAV
ncbi:hypothetical protein LRD17_12245 [Halorhodospira halochloris]|nr:hypothetical protein [Halorhodospira halochloris]